MPVPRADPAVAERLRMLLRGWYEEPRTAWARAFVACATGSFAEAIEHAAPALEDRDPFVRVQARITTGSALRQLGRHAAAHPIDDPKTAPTTIHAAHLFASRAADAVGAGDLDAATGALTRARGSLTASDDALPDALAFERMRARIRIGWVAAEIALARRDAPGALAALGAIDGTAPDWPRHVAKTALFRGVALRELDRSAAADASFERAQRIASSIGATPVVEIAAQLRGVRAP